VLSILEECEVVIQHASLNVESQKSLNKVDIVRVHLGVHRLISLILRGEKFVCIQVKLIVENIFELAYSDALKGNLGLYFSLNVPYTFAKAYGELLQPVAPLCCSKEGNNLFSGRGLHLGVHKVALERQEMPHPSVVAF
jgi:hypothetical protein